MVARKCSGGEQPCTRRLPWSFQVVSDFDTFTVGSMNMVYESLPAEQALLHINAAALKCISAT